MRPISFGLLLIILSGAKCLLAQQTITQDAVLNTTARSEYIVAWNDQPSAPTADVDWTGPSISATEARQADRVTFVPPPAAPSQLAAQATPASSVILTWWDNSNDETGFQIERAISGQSGSTLIATTGANVTTFTDAGLTPGIICYYKVRAFNASGNSAYSTEVSAQTFYIPPPPPAAPSQVAAIATSATTVQLTWWDNSDNETGFQIQRAKGNEYIYTLIGTPSANATTFTDTGVEPGTVYYYRIRAINSSGSSAYTIDVSTQTYPSPPIQLAAQALSTSSIRLTWVDNSNGETGFRIERSTGGTSGYALIATTSENATTFTDTGLASSTVYYYRVRTFNSTGNSIYTPDVSAQTLYVPPAAPSQTAAQAISSSSIIVTWLDHSNNETGFEIQRSISGQSGSTLITTTAANVTTFTDTGIAPGTVCYYQVRAINPAGASSYSTMVSAQTFFIPPAPSGLTAQATSGSSITLNWTDNAYNETGFQVERSTAEGSGFVLISTAPADATSFVDGGLSTGTTYYYRIRSSSAAGHSSYTSVASAKTFYPPAAPGQLAAQALSASSIQLTWVDNSINESGFQVERSTSASGGYSLIATTAANATTFTDGGLAPVTVYYYRVRAINSTGNSSYATAVSAQTFDIPPAAPSQLAAQATSSSTIVLTWWDNSGNETGFQIERTKSGENVNTIIATTSANVITFTDTGLESGAVYYYQVRAINAAGNSPYSTQVSAQTFFIPEPPSQLTALATSASSITLNWTDNSYNETGFQVERSTVEGGGFALINTVSADVETFVDGGLSTGTTYFYRVRSMSAAGGSAYTPVASAKTFYPPAAPSELITKIASPSSIALNWTDQSDNEVSFQVERSLSSGNGYSLIHTTSAGVTAFIDTQVSPETVYFYRVRATNAIGNSAYTNESRIKFLTEIDPGVISAVLDDWAFHYRYDSRNRMIKKKVPGSDWVYMVYDNRDRLVMTQDGNQRDANQWSFTKYDALDRPIITGLYTHNVPLSQEAMRTLISPTNFFETRDNNSPSGYTNTVFTSPHFIESNFENLTITFYDNYGFKTLLNDPRYNYKSDELPEQYTYDANGNSFPGTVGLVTGSKTKILGETGFLWNVNYFDDRYRIVQNVSANARGDIDRTTNVYDFVGKPVKTKTVHNVGLSAERTVARRFDYDHAERLLKTWHQTGTGNEVLLAQHEYNELGQLATKKLHNTDPASTADAEREFKQQADYRYNIRGWLARINDSELTSIDGGPKDYFGMEFGYNNNLGIGTFTPQYNGNISATKWSTNLGLAFTEAEPTQRAYRFIYDTLNRLKSAHHIEKTIGWDPSSGFGENNLSYDLNGNIKKLNRTGGNGSNMDQLEYTYIGNQLQKVDDHGITGEGFKDGVNTGNDYGYDSNGNLIVDRNKGIASIRYNYLNLPDTVIKDNGEYITYSYDATGQKLRQQVFDASNAVQKRTDYSGAFFYENDTLKFINHEEGRVVMTGAEPEYQYFLRDHLGNIRLTFTANEDEEEYLATLETENVANEQVAFLNYDEAVKINHDLFDHTFDGTTGSTYYSTRLTGGNTNAVYGLARSLSVMAGDTIKMEVFAKYLDPEEENWSAPLANFMAAIAGGTAPQGAVVDGGALGSAGSGTGFFSGIFDHSEESGAAPKAYLNFIVFDHHFNPIIGESGFIRITTASRENGNNVDHDKLERNEPLVIKQPGYVYIYLSNENETPVDVFFDDFKVTHIQAPVVQMDDYYPFGLTFNSYTRENSMAQDHKYNGKEEQKELGLGWLDYGQRMYQPELGRFFTPDRFADKYFDSSPYGYGMNNPILYVDINGDSVWTTSNSKTDGDGNTIVTNTVHITGKVLRQSSSTKATAQGVATGLNARLNSQKISSTKKNKDGTTTTTITKIQASYTVASSMNDVSTSDHLVVITDGVTGKADPNLGGGEAVGLAIRGGQIAYVEAADAVETAFHEVGHNLGLPHPDSNNGNPMSYTGRGANFSDLQMLQIFNMARNGVPNEGSNYATMGTAFPNAPFGTFYGTTTNERPFSVAPDRRAKIPLPLMNTTK